MSALDLLEDAIEKAGLIKPGKPSLLRRVGFLLSTVSNERNYKIGRYLEGRKAGKGFGPKGKRRARTGTYTGVYATGVNKSETVMDAIEALDEAIEKALRINGGVKVSPAQRRRIALDRGRFAKPVRDGTQAPSRFAGVGENGRSGVTRRALARVKANPSGENKRHLKTVRANNAFDLDRSAKRRGVPSSYKQTMLGGLKRVKKSTDAPTALDVLDEAIEKAGGMIRGGSKRMARVANRHADKKYEGKGRAGTPKGYSRASKLRQYTSLRASGQKSVRAGYPWSRDTVTPRRSK